MFYLTISPYFLIYFFYYFLFFRECKLAYAKYPKTRQFLASHDPKSRTYSDKTECTNTREMFIY